MKTLVKTASAVALTVAMGNTWAACPSSLSADQMYDCIVVEGAGSEYKDPKQAAKKKDNELPVLKAYGKRTDQQAKSDRTKHTDM